MEKPLNRFQKSMLLTRGAWRALMLDKHLSTIPLLAYFSSLILIVLSVVVGFLNPWGIIYSSTGSTPDTIANMSFKPLGIVLVALVALLTGLISAISMGAVTHGAIERFRGNYPTIKDSLSVAWRRKNALLGFVLFSLVVGYIINEIASRIPYIGGLIVSWLAGAAWGIASFFSIPIIIEDKESLNPIKATKKSLSMMKKIWGESLIAAVGVGLFELLVVGVYLTCLAIIVATTVLVFNPTSALLIASIVFWSIALLGLFAIVFVFMILEIYVKAALYYYATTGESPATFDRELLRQAFTEKKAKKAFSL